MVICNNLKIDRIYKVFQEGSSAAIYCNTKNYFDEDLHGMVKKRNMVNLILLLIH